MPTKAKAPGKMPLVGFVVAKKVCKSACARNRAKRRLREAYRHLRQSSLADPLSLSQWYAIVWVARDKALGATWQEVEQTVSECLSKANARYGAGSHSQRQADKSSPERQNAGRQPTAPRALPERTTTSRTRILSVPIVQTAKFSVLMRKSRPAWTNQKVKIPPERIAKAHEAGLSMRYSKESDAFGDQRLPADLVLKNAVMQVLPFLFTIYGGLFATDTVSPKDACSPLFDC